MQVLTRIETNNTYNPIQLLVYPDFTRVVTGKCARWNQDERVLWNKKRESITKEKTPTDLYQTLNCSKVVISATLRPLRTLGGWHVLLDQEDAGNVLFMHSSFVLETFNLVLDRKLEVKDGWISGEWDLKYFCGSPTIQSCLPKTNNLRLNLKNNNIIKDEKDALDVSHFL